MPPINLACPKCTQNNVNTQLQTDGHKIKCPAGHDFEDSEELSHYEMKPFSGAAFKEPPKQPPPNATTLSIALDSKLRDALLARYGDKMEQNIISILTVLANKGFFLVTAEEAKQLSEPNFLGQSVSAANVLLGAVFNLRKELIDAKEEARLAMEANKGGGAASSNGAGGLQIDFDIDTIAKMAEKAAFNGKALKPYIKEQVEYCLQQGWL